MAKQPRIWAEQNGPRRRPKAVEKWTENRLPKLDRVIHERMRLGILSALAVNSSLAFGDLKKLLDASDGNISVHTRRLEEAGYIECKKSFNGRVPRTEFRITAEGRNALRRYLNHMEALIAAMKRR